MVAGFNGLALNKTNKSGWSVIFATSYSCLQSFKITRFLASCIKEPFPCGAVFYFPERCTDMYVSVDSNRVAMGW